MELIVSYGVLGHSVCLSRCLEDSCQVCFGAGSRGRDDVVCNFPRTEKPFNEVNVGVKLRSTRLKKSCYF
jgi:hypothetical protein